VRFPPINNIWEWFQVPPSGVNLQELEREAIRQVLSRTGGNQKAAARLLRISPRAMNYKVRRFGFRHPKWWRNRNGKDKG
jgi:transcriptional regulator with GAF, ATPase, and Fis domain